MDVCPLFPLSELLLGVLFAAAAALAVWYFAQARTQSVAAQVLRADRDHLAEKLTQAELTLAESKGREALTQQLRDDLAAKTEALQNAERELSSLRSREAELNARKEELQTSFETQKKALQAEFKTLSESILQSRTEQFKKDSQESLGHLLNPLREQISAFQKRVNEVHQDSSNANSALKNELENLKSLNQRITDEASNLTQALKGDSKAQGNWGETQLEMILNRSGLIKGQEYLREQPLTDEQGASFRPDFIVNLPEGRHLIIDSKVSLVAWTEYVEAEDEPSREQALKRLVNSMGKHVDSLAGKDYSRLIGLRSPDFVLMFMPIEPAFLAAVQYDSGLFNRAFEKGVIVVVPSTLLGTLRTVANLWSLQKQGENAAEIADQASKLQDKLRIFMEKFERVGSQMATAQKTYDEAIKTLSGRGGLTSVVSQFERKGVRFKQNLPELNVDDDAPDNESDSL